MKFKFNKDIYDETLKACESGSEIAYEFSESIDDNGLPCLVSEEYNLQEVINSYADGCSIERIIIAHGLGDDLIINQKPGIYLDEDAVNSVKLGNDTQALNMKLYEMYQSYKGDLDFGAFANAVVTGNYEALNKKDVVKEGETNA